MARRLLRAVPAVAVLVAIFVFASPAVAQIEPAHEDGDASKCTKCKKAYEKALKYCLENLSKSSFMEKINIGYLLLADGGHKEDLDKCVAAAKRTAGMVGSSKWSNWYLGFGGLFLAVYYSHYPSEELQTILEQIAERAAEEQEPTGGWFSSKGAAKKADYPAQDHGQLTAMVYGMLRIMKKYRMKVPSNCLSRAEGYVQRQCRAGGITYGTGNPLGDTTGSRGGFAMFGLSYAGTRSHKVFQTYPGIYPRCIPNLRKGHHIGGWHFLGAILGTYTIGRGIYSQLCAKWMGKLISEQRDDGGFYLGDDKASGGETGLFGGDRSSTASLALLILLKNHPDQLKPPKKKKGSAKGGSSRGGSPFGRKKPKPKSKPKDQ